MVFFSFVLLTSAVLVVHASSSNRIGTTAATALLPSSNTTTAATCSATKTDHHLQRISDLEKELLYQINHPVNVSNTRVILSNIRLEIVSNYQTLALLYNTTTSLDERTRLKHHKYAALSLQSANHMRHTQTRLFSRYQHLQYNVLPHGHETNPKLLSDLARVHHQLGHLQESEMFYLKSIEVDGLAYNNLVNALTERNQWNRSKRVFSKAIDRKTNVECKTRKGWKWVKESESSGHINSSDDRTNSSNVIVRVLPRHWDWDATSTNNNSDHKISYIVTLHNVSMTGTSGVLFRSRLSKSSTFNQSPRTQCEIYLGGHNYMHRLRYERAQQHFVSGYLSDMKHEPLLPSIPTQSDNTLVLNLVQGWSNNFYHSLIEMGGRMALLQKYVVQQQPLHHHHHHQHQHHHHHHHQQHHQQQENKKEQDKNYVYLIPIRTNIVKRILSLFDTGSDRPTPSFKYIEYQPKRGIQYDISTLVWADWETNDGDEAFHGMYYPADHFVPSSLALHLLAKQNPATVVLEENNDQYDEQRYRRHHPILIISRQGSKRGRIIGEEMLFDGLNDVFVTQRNELLYSVELFRGHNQTLAEQAALFQSVSGVVGVHGGM